MDIIFEFLIELYVELMMQIVPEEKAVTRKYRIIAVLVAITGILANLAAFVFGIVLIVGENDLLGLIPLTVALLLSAAQIAMGIKVRIKHK